MVYNIRGYHGGLGDQLQFSSFAEKLVKLGHKVQLYDGPEVEPFRNQGIKELVWDLNPFVTGTSNTNWNMGDIPNLPYKNICDDYIQNWEIAHNLEPENSLPKIYYQPLKKDNVFGVIELSSITLKYNTQKVVNIVNNIIAEAGIPFKQLITPGCNHLVSIPGLQPVFVQNLMQICDVLHSCKTFVSLNSGTHSLAAAVQRFGTFNQHCILPEADYDWIMAGKRFVYPGINYIKE